MIQKLLFVYNADSGLFNTLTDAVHKIISPSTYSCNLCAVTYGMLGMKREWKEFITGLEVKVEFLHRDEFTAQFGVKEELPAVFSLTQEKPSLLISAKEINKCKTLGGLEQLVKSRI